MIARHLTKNMHMLPLSLALLATMVSAVYSQADAKPDQFMQRFPTLQKNGKTVVVSPDEYIKHHLKGATTKYKLIAVPDG